MNPTLERLWNGTLTPCKNCGNCDPEIHTLIMLMQRNRDALLKELPPQGKELFQKYMDSSEEYTYLLTAHAFSDGFSLATKLIAESISAS